VKVMGTGTTWSVEMTSCPMLFVWGGGEGVPEDPNYKDRLRGERCLYSGLYDKIEKREETVVDSNQGFPYLQYSVESIDIKGQTGILTDQFQINLNEVSQKYELSRTILLHGSLN
jgi:hypothetical protein